MGYNVNEIIVTIDGKDVPLNWEQTKQIREQFRIQDAIDVLDAYGDINIDIIDRETLLHLGEDLEDAIYDNVGDVEYAVVDNYLQDGLIIRIEEEEDDEDI